MAFTYHRDGTRFIWGCWTDSLGNEQRGSMETEDEREAKARAAELERQARGSDAPAAAAGELSVQDFAKGEWLKLRKVAKPFAWRDDQSRLTHHFFPQFGNKPLTWLSTDDGGRAVFQWAVGLKTHKAKRDGEPLAPRTVWNTFSTVRVLLDDACELKRLKVNPLATFRADKYLPTKADKNEGWRESAGFDVGQVVKLTTSAKLDERRRVWNVLAFMVGGARTGELANLRWKDWTESYKGGLGRLVIAKAYNSREGKEKATKTGAKKLIPVHPFAATVLKAWHEQGWKEWMGREPKPEDFIVSQSDGKQLRNWKLLQEFYADLDTLKIDRQRQYENRSTFRNLLLCAGAPEFIVNLMTHPSPKQASDFYTRLEMQWPAMCEAILKLDAPEWRAPVAKVTAQVTVATGTDGPGPKYRGKKLEPTPGLEPGTYGLRKRSFSGPEAPAPTPDVSGQCPTVPALRIVDAATAPEVPAPILPVTSDTGAFMDAVLEAEARNRLRRLLRAAGEL